MSKGSKRRPLSVSDEQFRENWDAIWGRDYLTDADCEEIAAKLNAQPEHDHAKPSIAENKPDNVCRICGEDDKHHICEGILQSQVDRSWTVKR